MFKMHLKDYDINLGSLTETLPVFPDKNAWSQTAVLVDENTRRHCLPRLEDVFGANFVTIEIPAGEPYKTLDTCQKVWSEMLRHGLDRHAVLVNLGGGVIGDLGGFCAATYMRGIPFIQIPTTLMAMADSSVGGKVGVDFHFVKNIIGVFKNPKAVFIDPDFLCTLPLTEIRSGFAEIIKHALIADAGLWQSLKTLRDLQGVDWMQFLPRSLEVKKRLVEEDPLELSLRRALNFGHTAGHAVESFSLQNGRPLLHGEAVALGMVCEGFLSHKMAGLSAGHLTEIISLVQRFYPPYFFEKSDVPSILAFMKKDKKNKNGRIRCSLLPRVGEVVVDQECDEKIVVECLSDYLQLIE